MRVTWLGQAGLLFNKNGYQIMIDPYLSDSIGALNPHKRRTFPVDEKVLKIKPDIMIFTHDHLDHFDPDTAKIFLHENSGVTVLSPCSVWEKVRLFPGNHNCVMLNPGTTWTENNLRFTAVKAEHSDPKAIGVILNDGERKYYITGDTLYNEAIFSQLPEDIYAVFLPVNGQGNNMNMTDAANFGKRIGAKFIVPIHYGLFDSINIDTFDVSNKITLKLFEEMEILL